MERQNHRIPAPSERFQPRTLQPPVGERIGLTVPVGEVVHDTVLKPVEFEALIPELPRVCKINELGNALPVCWRVQKVEVGIHVRRPVCRDTGGRVHGAAEVLGVGLTVCLVATRKTRNVLPVLQEMGRAWCVALVNQGSMRVFLVDFRSEPLGPVSDHQVAGVRPGRRIELHVVEIQRLGLQLVPNNSEKLFAVVPHARVFIISWRTGSRARAIISRGFRHYRAPRLRTVEGAFGVLEGDGQPIFGCKLDDQGYGQVRAIQVPGRSPARRVLRHIFSICGVHFSIVSVPGRVVRPSSHDVSPRCDRGGPSSGELAANQAIFCPLPRFARADDNQLEVPPDHMLQIRGCGNVSDFTLEAFYPAPSRPCPASPGHVQEDMRYAALGLPGTMQKPCASTPSGTVYLLRKFSSATAAVSSTICASLKCFFSSAKKASSTERSV